jgi:hypothetical protein
MNRLILLGNGFDLAHGMKTGYNDFILWYLKHAYNTAHKNGSYEDLMIKITRVYSDAVAFGDLRSIDDLVDHFYHKGFNVLLYRSEFSMPGWLNIYTNPFSSQLKSNLITTLLKTCSFTNWVEIENEYYRDLKEILRKNEITKRDDLTKLNNTLACLIHHLQAYLTTLPEPKYEKSYRDIITSSFKFPIQVGDQRLTNQPPENIMVLNFNYTSTVEQYIENSGLRIPVNYIHGRLNDGKNPMIFGFGDELDKDYQLIEDEQNNQFFTYMKSFWYFLNIKYTDLIRFIDDKEYQVYVLGHSCGLSDRTMLNMVFEHENCKHIQIFYYEKENGEDNFTELTQEISRHFKDKGIMRKKITSKEESSPMPQVQTLEELSH